MNSDHLSTSPKNTQPAPSSPMLVTAGNGKTGRRIVRRLVERGQHVRVASRGSTTKFDWNDEHTWVPALAGTKAAYLAYVPDLAFPGGVETVEAFARTARNEGVERLVLLSGRGEPAALRAEEAVVAAGVPTTIVRASWFMQDFSEHFLLGPVLDGVIAVPADNVAEPFVDAEDIADIASAALLSSDHAGKTYEVTGPRSLTFAEAARVLSEVTGRAITYQPVTPEEYATGAKQAGVPEEEIQPLIALFTEVLDGRNSVPTTGIEDALGRPGTDFTTFARREVLTGVWAHR